MRSSGASSSVLRSRYVSWFVDPPPQPPTPAATASSSESSQPAGPGSDHDAFTDLQLHSDPPHPHPHHHPHPHPHPHSDEGEGTTEELHHPEDELLLLLPRSSPLVSRRLRPGASSDPSDPSSRSDSQSLLQVGPPTGPCMKDVGPKPSSCPPSPPLQEDRKLSCAPPPSSDRRCSGVPEFSADILKPSCELEQENSHFVVVDLVLEVLEGVKWTLSSDTHQQHTHCSMYTHRHTHRHTHSSVHTQQHTHSSVHTQQHTQDEEEEEEEHPPKTFSILSTDSGFEDCGAENTLTPRESLTNAEALAQQLVLDFRRSWFPSREPRRGRLSLRSSLQELPGTVVVAMRSSSLTEEIRLRTRMRGGLSWTPPQVQIIVTVQPTHRRSEVVALQNFLCAGCGTELEPRYLKKLRYCEYLGRYFCVCCHSGSEAVIPARLLSCWDFSRYPVSDFSKQLLDSVWFQPLFDLNCVGQNLFGRVKELHRFRELQEQLVDIRKLLRACRLSGRLLCDFQQLPPHLLQQPLLFSMDDLLKVKKGQMVLQARALLQAAAQHVHHCQLCLARGFICEFCRERDVIFPFQKDVCRRCPVCRACFHKHCFVEKRCPKCARIQSRKKRPDGSRK